MINLSDLSSLMQCTIAKGITFMVSKSGLPNDYNLYFAKYIDGKGNCSVRLSYHENEGKIIQYADENHSITELNGTDEALEYVESELNK